MSKAIDTDAVNQLLKWVQSQSKTVDITSKSALTRIDFDILPKLNTLSESTSNLTERLEVTEECIASEDPHFGSVPDYYGDMLEAKVSEIIDNMRSVGREGLTFFFVTDIHWNSNSKVAPSLIRYINDKTGVNLMINGGDNITSGTHYEMVEEAFETTEYFRKSIPNGTYLMTMGNHDSNRNGHGDDSSFWMTPAEIYATAFYATPCNAIFRGEAYVDKTTERPRHDYYYDIPKLKIRIVSIDTMGNAYLSNDSSDWLGELLAVDDGYKYIVAIHALYGVSSEGVITPLYQSSIDYLYGIVSAHAAKIMCILTGHTHIDGSFTFDSSSETGTIPVIMTDTNAYQGLSSFNPNTAELGTVTEQCMDVITVSTVDGSVKCVRIGRGDDRTATHG